MNQDGNVVFQEACRTLGLNAIELVTRTALWVHPDIFRALPVWYPEFHRGASQYKRAWTEKRMGKTLGAVREARETNEHAQIALKAAVGIRKSKDWPNWTCCHIWGYDDTVRFSRTSQIVKDSRFYSCVANMVLVPTPVKAFTDALPEVKEVLRYRAYQLYGWVCEHEDAAPRAAKIRTGRFPGGYPAEWRNSTPESLGARVQPVTDQARSAMERRMKQIASQLGDPMLVHYPRDQVKQVLRFWNIRLPHQ